ncbi:hypothetical protein CDL12_04077 [Handroanthus impetiginosus]|uniref:Auxin efflux carrier component n=1 Tax=Handroanthus impetiginosus TaxID=429701 RepID=A0A2G9I0B4_9LAMI|nr:hypothetical protein CDL12_04077 [Handroanthus impetiginosus]
MNYRFLIGDMVAKAIVAVVLALWANLWREANLSWTITVFSIATMNNILVVGVPLLKAIYGPLGEDLVVQSSVIQSLLWFPLLLFILEFKEAIDNNSKNCDPGQLKPQLQPLSCSIEIVGTTNGANHTNTVATDDKLQEDPMTPMATSEISIMSPPSLRLTLKKVGAKLARNPNLYACALGLIWALLAKRWNFEMPSIVDGSIQIMSTAGSGVAMFSMGLRGNVLRIVLIQAALPHAINSFVFAQEYGLHANLLSTSVFVGTIISLPLLIVYCVILDMIH